MVGEEADWFIDKTRRAIERESRLSKVLDSDLSNHPRRVSPGQVEMVLV